MFIYKLEVDFLVSILVADYLANLCLKLQKSAVIPYELVLEAAYFIVRKACIWYWDRFQF